MNPVSGKVTGATGTAVAVGALTWALTTFIPAWHSGIPDQLGTALPWIVATAGAFAGGWIARHRAQAHEIQLALNDAIGIIEAYRSAAETDGPPAIPDHIAHPPPERV